MGESDRLHQLRQQRAKIAEHLAWLDQEIAKATHGETQMGARSEPNLKLRVTSPAPAPIQLESNNPSPGSTVDPNAVLEDWLESDASTAPRISKTGCWVAFSAVLIIGIIGLLAFVSIYYDSADT